VDVTTGVEVEGRVLALLRGEQPGPTLLCIGGLHGNEPAGIYAIRRVLQAPAVADAGKGAPPAIAGALGALHSFRKGR
jgi:succinylglutamate desuccinylase